LNTGYNLEAWYFEKNDAMETITMYVPLIFSTQPLGVFSTWSKANYALHNVAIEYYSKLECDDLNYYLSIRKDQKEIDNGCSRTPMALYHIEIPTWVEDMMNNKFDIIKQCSNEEIDEMRKMESFSNVMSFTT